LRRGIGVRLPGAVAAEEVGVFDEAGGLVAVAAVERGRGLLRPTKVVG
jgi:hypothetical protein